MGNLLLTSLSTHPAPGVWENTKAYGDDVPSLFGEVPVAWLPLPMFGSFRVNVKLFFVQEGLIGQFQEHALGIYEVRSLGNSRKEAGPEGSKSPYAFASFGRRSS